MSSKDNQRTKLYQQHLQAKAKMVPFAGWEMPIQYSSIKDEVNAVRQNIGVFDVSHMGEFFVEGAEATKFVDYMLTNEVASVEEKKAVYSPICREDGTVIDDLIAYKLSSDRILICVNAANIEKDWNWFNQHVEKFECTLTDRSADYSLLALQGPKTEEILMKLELLTDAASLEYYSAQEREYAGEKLIFARTGYTGEDGFEIFCPNSYVTTLWDKLMALDVYPCGLAARDILRMEVCYPLYGHEIHDEVTPLDSALKWSVKLNKEQFLGKEALTAYTPKYRLIKLALDKGIPRAGYPIENQDGQQIGTITSGTMSITLNKGIALGHVEKEKFDTNMELFVNIRNRKYKANFQTKAFVTGGHK